MSKKSSFPPVITILNIGTGDEDQMFRIGSDDNDFTKNDIVGELILYSIHDMYSPPSFNLVKFLYDLVMRFGDEYSKEYLKPEYLIALSSKTVYDLAEENYEKYFPFLETGAFTNNYGGDIQISINTYPLEDNYHGYPIKTEILTFYNAYIKFYKTEYLEQLRNYGKIKIKKRIKNKRSYLKIGIDGV